MMTAYSHCKFCLGQGCIACDGERARDIEQSQEPLFIADAEDPNDLDLLKNAVGARAIEGAFGPNGGGVKELELNLLLAQVKKMVRRDTETKRGTDDDFHL
jgi:hypothetical protein